jgi:hypothetical protein
MNSSTFQEATKRSHKTELYKVEATKRGATKTG